MDLLLKAIQQAPFVAIFAYLWWQNRKDLMKRVSFLEEENRQKDGHISNFIKTIDKFTLTLELIKDRLR